MIKKTKIFTVVINRISLKLERNVNSNDANTYEKLYVKKMLLFRNKYKNELRQSPINKSILISIRFTPMTRL